MNEHFNTGMLLAEILHGLPPGECVKESAAQEAAGSLPQVHRSLCRLAEDLYAACGKSASAECLLYGSLSREDLPVSAYAPFTEPLVEVLGELDFCKEAGGKVFLPRLVGGVAGLVPSSLTTAAALSVLLGSGVGAGAWLLNRDVGEDNAELENIRRRVEQYDRATAELSNKLRRKGMLPDEQGEDA